MAFAMSLPVGRPATFGLIAPACRLLCLQPLWLERGGLSVGVTTLRRLDGL